MEPLDAIVNAIFSIVICLAQNASGILRRRHQKEAAKKAEQAREFLSQYKTPEATVKGLLGDATKLNLQFHVSPCCLQNS